MKEAKTIGQKLKYLRTHYTEYTQEEVADLLNIPRQTYGRYESDYRNPKHAQIIEFAKFYGISSFFLCDNDFSYIRTETSGDVLALIIENIKLGVLKIGSTEQWLYFSFDRNRTVSALPVELKASVFNWYDLWKTGSVEDAWIFELHESKRLIRIFGGM